MSIQKIYFCWNSIELNYFNIGMDWFTIYVIHISAHPLCLEQLLVSALPICCYENNMGILYHYYSTHWFYIWNKP